jgi:hypothetical protein
VVHRPDTVFRVARTAPVGPTHAVCAVTGAPACGIEAKALVVLDEDWEAACFVENAPTGSPPSSVGECSLSSQWTAAGVLACALDNRTQLLRGAGPRWPGRAGLALSMVIAVRPLRSLRRHHRFLVVEDAIAL